MFKIYIGVHEAIGNVMYEYTRVTDFNTDGGILTLKYINTKGKEAIAQHNIYTAIETHILSSEAELVVDNNEFCVEKM